MRMVLNFIMNVLKVLMICMKNVAGEQHLAFLQFV